VTEPLLSPTAHADRLIEGGRAWVANYHMESYGPAVFVVGPCCYEREAEVNRTYEAGEWTSFKTAYTNFLAHLLEHARAAKQRHPTGMAS
jgi:hypothetical protein